MVTQYGFYANTDECIGCRMCIIACKDKNDLPVGEKFRRVYDYSGGEWTVENGVMNVADLFAYSVTAGCNHCAAPACITVCPVSAITKREDGIVVIDEEACIGCEACVPACPYEIPYMSKETSVARKCDFCIDLIENGENPVCVQSCQIRCLEYGELEELKKAHPEAVSIVPPLPESGTGPSCLYGPHRMNPDGSLKGEIRNAPEEITFETFTG